MDWFASISRRNLAEESGVTQYGLVLDVDEANALAGGAILSDSVAQYPIAMAVDPTT